MGLREILSDGASLRRRTVSFISDATGTGSVEIGSAYALLNVSVDTPCRVRLYDNQSSRDDSIEYARPYGQGILSSSTALTIDFTASAAGTYSINPVLYSVSDSYDSPETYYLVSASSQVSISLDIYDIEDNTVSSENRKSVTISATSLEDGTYRSGSVSINVPRTYLLVSSSLSDPSHETRLRLYSTDFSFSDTTEITRGFYDEVSSSAYLIADMIVTGSETTYFVPKIIGANVETMGSNLFEIRTSRQAIDGVSEIYYIVENLVPSTTVDVNHSLYLYSLED